MSGLHELVIKTIRRAQSQGGLVDPVEDFEALVELDRLARAATEPPQEARMIFLDLPLVVGDVQLYRLSWGALDWVADCAGTWWADDGRMYDRALAWAHAHARSPGAFRRCASVREASAEISRWARNQSASWQAIMAGVDRLMEELRANPNDQRSQHESKASAASLFDVLLETHGGTIEYWMWEVSMVAMKAFCDAIRYRNEENAIEMAAASGKAPDADSQNAASTIRFQRAARAFVEAVVARSGQTVVGNQTSVHNTQKRRVEERKHMSADSVLPSSADIGDGAAGKPEGE